MNKRILEIAEEARAETCSRPPMRAVTGLAFTNENLEKFAELIIQECAMVADGNFNKGFCPVGDYIKQHFGVKW
jgi:hypothetical protein